MYKQAHKDRYEIFITNYMIFQLTLKEPQGFPPRRFSVISIGKTEVKRRMSTINSACIIKLNMQNVDFTEEETKMKPSDWFHEPRFYLIGLCYVSSRLINSVSMGYIIYYAQFTLLLAKEFNSIVPLTMFISGFIMPGCLEIAKRRFSIEALFLASCIAGVGKPIDSIFLKFDRL